METITGKIYDIQGFSVQDGPGIRTTVFLKGCPLRCPWCHSPESQQFHTQLNWMAARCIGVATCGKCLAACPKDAISLGKIIRHAVTQEEIQHIRIQRSLCDDCGDCTKACHPNALYMCGRDYTVEELIEYVGQDMPFYEESGGGVTLSGGEALSQPQFTYQVLKGLKARAIHTALDTTGHAGFRHIAAVLPYTDLFLYDLKHMNSKLHQATIGVPNDLILENAKKIAAAGGKLQVRIPVVPNFNDTEKNITAAGEFCRSLGHAVTCVQLLPYHNLGAMKYQRLSEEPTVLEAQPPSDEKIEVLIHLLEDQGLTVMVH